LVESIDNSGNSCLSSFYLNANQSFQSHSDEDLYGDTSGGVFLIGEICSGF